MNTAKYLEGVERSYKNLKDTSPLPVAASPGSSIQSKTFDQMA